MPVYVFTINIANLVFDFATRFWSHFYTTFDIAVSFFQVIFVFLLFIVIAVLPI